jgi:hypothetical protein
MKKFILGLLLGAGLMLTGSIFAADIPSLIGQTVQGTFPVQVNGTQIQDAIVVNNASYLPARMIAELFNSDVSFIDNQVIVKAKDGASVSQAKLDEYKKMQDDKTTQWQKDKDANNAQVKAEEAAAAKIRAEGDAEAAKAKAELDRKAQEAAQQQKQQSK